MICFNFILKICFHKDKIEVKYDNDQSELPLIPRGGKLTVFQKLCFAVGGLPYQMCGNALGLFIPAFLLEIAQVLLLFLN